MAENGGNESFTRKWSSGSPMVLSSVGILKKVAPAQSLIRDPSSATYCGKLAKNYYDLKFAMLEMLLGNA
jgi:hypothetical protein